MKLSTRQDIARPADDVFRAISDYAFFEAALRDRGIEVSRTGESGPDGRGTSWEALYDFRGHNLRILTEITDYAPDERIVSMSRTSGLEGRAEFAVTPVTPQKSRLLVGIDIRPTSIAGRVLLQPLKLSKSAISERLEARVASWARRIEARG